MKVAVTGATGCLGQPLVEKLSETGVDINALVLPKDPTVEAFQGRLGVVTGSLCSDQALRELTKDCDIVFHLAGKVHSVPRNREEKQRFYEVNVNGTKSVIDAAAINKVKRVIFYSSVGVYGKDADFHGDELSVCMPDSVYAKSKYVAEQLILNSQKSGGPVGVVLRLPVAYGPLDRGNVASLIRAVFRKRFFYFGEGDAVRSMISSENAAEAAIKAAFEPRAANNVFCVTDGRDYSVRELVEAICAAIRTSWKPRRLPLGMAELVGKLGTGIQRMTGIQAPVTSDIVRKLSRPLTFSSEKARELLGYKPVTTLQLGIFEEVSWLKETERWA